MRYILNILGSFGSGKSSLARALMPPDTNPRLLTFADAYGQNIPRPAPAIAGEKEPRAIRPKKVLATVYPAVSTAWVGPYHSACGGCDALVKVEIFAALEYLVFSTDYNVVFEGVAVSGVRTYLNHLRNLPLVTDIKPLVIALHAPVETHKARVMQRNGGKPINQHHIESKHRAVEARIRELADMDLDHTIINQPSIQQTLAKAKTFLTQHAY